MAGVEAYPSRAGKKQIVGFLGPDAYQWFQDYVRQRQISQQRALGEILNAAAAKYGYRPPFHGADQRVFRRNRRVASPRSRSRTRPARVGKKAVSGWFDASTHAEVKRIAKQERVTINQAVYDGLTYVFDPGVET